MTATSQATSVDAAWASPRTPTPEGSYTLDNTYHYLIARAPGGGDR